MVSATADRLFWHTVILAKNKEKAMESVKKFVEQNKPYVIIGAFVFLTFILSVVALSKKAPAPNRIERTLLAQIQGPSVQPGSQLISNATISNPSTTNTLTGIFSVWFFVPSGSSFGSELNYVLFDKGDGTETMVFGPALSPNQSTVVTIPPGGMSTVKLDLSPGFTLGQQGTISLYWTPFE